MALNGTKKNCKIQKQKIMENKIAPPFTSKDLQPEAMVKINVCTDIDHVCGAVFKRMEVSEGIYKILQQKVIKSLTNNVELQTFLQDAKFTLDKFMESSITEKMLNEAVNEI